MDQFEEDSKIETTRTVEEKKEQRRATDIMDDIRDRLRGFSRTIPSFIMAYSDRVLANLACDTVIETVLQPLRRLRFTGMIL